jgi:carbon monoxide dehydrogenase subunit G
VIELSRTIELPAPPPEVWALLWDIPALARCVPGCDEVREVEPGIRYTATVRDRVGPFKVAVPLDVSVESRDPPRRLAVKAAGRDSMLASPVTVSLAVALEPAGPGTRLVIQGAGEIGGKLAALGQGVIQRKTRDILDRFAANLGARLGGETGAPAV